MSDNGEYLDCVVFLEGKNGSKKPRTIGRAQIKSRTEVKVWIDVMPVGKWDGSILIQPPRDRREANGNGGRGNDPIPFGREPGDDF